MSDAEREAFFAFLDGGESLAGFRKAPGADRYRDRAYDGSARVAVHPVRRALRLASDGVVVEEAPGGRDGERFAASPSQAVARLRERAALLARGYELVTDTPLALDEGEDMLVERSGEDVFVTCSDPEGVIAVARERSAQLRFLDENVTSSSAEPTGPLEELLRMDGRLTIARDSDGRFVQRRLVGDVVDSRRIGAGEVAWLHPEGWSHSERVARWCARERLAWVPSLRDRARESSAAAAAREAGWTSFDEPNEVLGGLVAIAAWGGLADAQQGPPTTASQADPFVTTEDGPLLPLGRFPEDGALFVDERGWLYAAPHLETPSPYPVATSAHKWLEKRALLSSLPFERTGGAPWVQVKARAGKNFWKRVRGERDEAASDEVSEVFVGEGLCLERGVSLEAKPYVTLWLAPADDLVSLVSRLARTTSGAQVTVRVDHPGGRERWALLQQAGVPVSCQPF